MIAAESTRHPASSDASHAAASTGVHHRAEASDAHAVDDSARIYQPRVHTCCRTRVPVSAANECDRGGFVALGCLAIVPPSVVERLRTELSRTPALWDSRLAR